MRTRRKCSDWRARASAWPHNPESMTGLNFKLDRIFNSGESGVIAKAISRLTRIDDHPKEPLGKKRILEVRKEAVLNVFVVVSRIAAIPIANRTVTVNAGDRSLFLLPSLRVVRFAPTKYC